LQQREAQQQQDDEMGEEHFSTILPEPVAPLLDSDPMVERKSKKRGIPAVTTLTPIPKKPRSPEIAQLTRYSRMAARRSLLG